MANYRIPRGLGVNVPQYRELSEGVRPEATAVPMEAWTGLPPVQIEEIHHDPIVILPGTFVGMATGGLASGKLFPCHGMSATGALTLHFTADDATWGLPITDTVGASGSLTNGPVLPLGVVYNSVYSFNLQNAFINYKRSVNVGVLTDYLVQIPAVTANEKLISIGEPVMIDQSTFEYGRVGELASINNLMGRLARFDGNAASIKYLVGRCFGKILFATGAATTRLGADTTYTLTPAGKSEWKGLDKVQTVPGLGLAGSGTKGVPSWLMDARSDGSGGYYLLNILVRL